MGPDSASESAVADASAAESAVANAFAVESAVADASAAESAVADAFAAESAVADVSASVMSSLMNAANRLAFLSFCVASRWVTGNSAKVTPRGLGRRGS